jgi:RNA polymerase sigma factor (sigma-70 family)
LVALSKTHLARASAGAALWALRLPREGWLDRELTGQLLCRRQAQELRVARSFRECRGLTTEELEDVYQDSALALMGERFENERHLRNELRIAIKYRALHVHRDERRHQRIHHERAADIHILASARPAEQNPEDLALAGEDRRIIVEFLAELDATQQKVFWLAVENGTHTGYHRIALALGISNSQARNALRACEQKRERWLLLYSTGRLCGYRSRTITAIQAGQDTSRELAQRAAAHLQNCPSCRSEHHITARRLQRIFEQQAAALLPIPVLATRAGWLTHAKHTGRHLKSRLANHIMGHRIVHGRLALLYSSEATSAKLARLATTAALAAGALTATHALTAKHHTPAATRAAITSTHPLAPIALLTPLAKRIPAPQHALVLVRPSRSRARTPGHVLAPGHAASSAERKQRAPGGFAYLGVPTSHPAPAPGAKQSHIPGGGGEFSP